MRTHQKASEVLQLPASDYKLQNTNFGVNQYICKYVLVTLTVGHRISMPLLRNQCLLVCVLFSCPEKKKNPKQQGWDLCLKMTVLLILCFKNILNPVLKTIQLWIEISFHIPWLVLFHW